MHNTYFIENIYNFAKTSEDFNTNNLDYNTKKKNKYKVLKTPCWYTSFHCDDAKRKLINVYILFSVPFKYKGLSKLYGLFFMRKRHKHIKNSKYLKVVFTHLFL